MESPNMQSRRYCVVYEVFDSSTDSRPEERRTFHETHEQMITFLVKLLREDKRVMATYECKFLPMNRQKLQASVDARMAKERQENIMYEELKREGEHLYNEFLRTLPPEIRKILKQKE